MKLLKGTHTSLKNLNEEEASHIVKTLKGVKGSRSGRSDEKLSGVLRECYSARLGIKPRVIYTYARYQGESVIVVLAYLGDHEYKRYAASYRRSDLDLEAPGIIEFELESEGDKAEVGSEESSEEVSEESLVDIATLQRRDIEVFPYGKPGTYIQLDPDQQAATAICLPAFIHGEAGSGKSLVGLRYLLAKLIASSDGLSGDSGKRFLYLTANEQLVKNMKHAFFKMAIEAGLAEADIDRVLFQTRDAYLGKKPLIEDISELKKRISAYLSEELSEAKNKKKKLGRQAKQSKKGHRKDVDEESLNAYVRGLRIRSGFKDNEAYLNFQSSNLKRDRASREKDNRIYDHIFGADYAYFESSRVVSAGAGGPASGMGVAPEDKIECVVFDESQESSLGLLKALYLRFDHQVLFLIGSHQMLSDELSRVIYIKDVMGNKKRADYYLGSEITELHFKHGYRCSKHVSELVQQVILAKEKELGSAHKLDRSSADECAHTERDGRVAWYDQKGFNLSSLGLDANTYVIMSEAQRSEYTGPGLILTPEEAQGLEIAHIILYQPLSDWLRSGTIDATKFDALITGMTRALVSVSIVQEMVHEFEAESYAWVGSLKEWVESKTLEAEALESTSKASTHEQWSEAIVELIKAGRLSKERIVSFIENNPIRNQDGDTKESSEACYKRLQMRSLGRKEGIEAALDSWSSFNRDSTQSRMRRGGVKSVFASRGYTEHVVPGDGNCFFHAVLWQLKEIAYVVPDGLKGRLESLGIGGDVATWDYQTVRQIGIDAMLNEPPVGFGGESWDSYLHDMVADGTWATGEIITILAKALQVDIHLIRSDGEADIVISSESGLPKLTLAYYPGLHFNALKVAPAVVASEEDAGVEETKAAEPSAKVPSKARKRRGKKKKGEVVQQVEARKEMYRFMADVTSRKNMDVSVNGLLALAQSHRTLHEPIVKFLLEPTQSCHAPLLSLSDEFTDMCMKILTLIGSNTRFRDVFSKKATEQVPTFTALVLLAARENKTPSQFTEDTPSQFTKLLALANEYENIRSNLINVLNKMWNDEYTILQYIACSTEYPFVALMSFAMNHEAMRRALIFSLTTPTKTNKQNMLHLVVNYNVTRLVALIEVANKHPSIEKELVKLICSPNDSGFTPLGLALDTTKSQHFIELVNFAKDGPHVLKAIGVGFPALIKKGYNSALNYLLTLASKRPALSNVLFESLQQKPSVWRGKTIPEPIFTRLKNFYDEERSKRDVCQSLSDSLIAQASVSGKSFSGVFHHTDEGEKDEDPDRSPPH